MDFSKGREGWDRYYMERCKGVAEGSRDPSTKCGAIIVRGTNKTVASTGFNGFPRKLRDDPELYRDRKTKYRRTIHSEMNAILFAGEFLDGCTLYSYPLIPCDRCAVCVIQAGIVRVVAPPIESHPERWREPVEFALALFQEAGVEFTPYYGFH